jgi:hypothetical protein
MKNNGKILTKNLDFITKDLNEAIKIIKKIYPNTEIKNTKLGKLQNIIAKQGRISDRQIADANRYGRLYRILADEKLEIKIETLKRLLKGSFEGEYFSDKSDDIFFEIDFAARIKEATGLTPFLNSETDVIIPGRYLIECKKVTSKLRIQSNINKAVEQIIDRFHENDCPYGIVALDLSSIIEEGAIKAEFLSRFEFFKKEYKKIGYSEDQAEVLIMNDLNLRKIIGTFGNAMLEFAFINGFKNEKLPLNISGIFYQAEIFITRKNNLHPFRVATYFLNNVPNNEKQAVTDFFHSLETGV